jgi:RNA polymerase sigma factor (sigma-70 family)
MPVNTWAQMTGGDKDAFLTLYQSHYQALFAYGFSLSANRELTKDCIQELFLEIWKKRPSLNKEVSNVRAYLFTWLRRKISREVSLINQAKFSQGIGENNPPIQFSCEQLLIAFQQSEEKKQQLRFALEKLTKTQLEVIWMKFFENLSCQQIAERKALSPRTVYNLIYEAVKHLRDSMKQYTLQTMN